ncbi:hypothetical protein JXA02_06850 [candidate division KSB1 bacterium]|nr:hypothetical protein [candidate division KSB1 bacterium]RQW06795.1 MAG: hypothetical protein EH222_08005 [candidate division KSB1 bacterium]
MNARVIISFIYALSFSLFAVSPRIVTHDSKVDFSRGTLKNVTIFSDGTLTPAPVRSLIFDTGEPFIWCIAEDSKGDLYLGTGNDGKVFKITTKGDTALILDADELGVFALALDTKDNLYAATSPKGKVYKISASGASTIFFDPDTDYIWDLAIDANDALLVATGAKAFIYRITESDKTVLFQGEENHVRSIRLAPDGTIYAGTSTKGIVYRIKPNAKPFALFDPQMEEITGMVIDDAGNIYASAFGQSFVLPPLRREEQERSDGGGGEEEEDQDGEDAALTAQLVDVEVMKTRAAPTSLFKISPDGHARDLWIGVDERIQSIARYNADEILVGSGQTGKLVTINDAGEVSILLENEESHITCILKNARDQIVFGASNLGRSYRLESALADTARFISETIDAGLPTRWGTLAWEGNAAASASTFSTRSGNTEQPSQSWSEWIPVAGDGDVWRINSPDARFIQWQCELKNKETRIDKVSLSYIQKNSAPRLSSIIVHEPGDYYEAKSNGADAAKGIIFPAPLPNKTTKKGYRTVDWLFEDANFDGLCFDVYYHPVGLEWRLLARDLTINFYAWDSAQMADGEYELKIAASDKLANPENLAMQGDKVSQVFTIDNSPPAIVMKNSGANALTVRVVDAWSPLEKVEYSIDAQEWQLIHPVDGIMDAKSESFEIGLPDGGPHEVALKATDSVNNVAVVHTMTK